MLVASLLATSGSVIAKPDRISPSSSGASQRCFCSSVPKPRIGLPTRPLETETIPRTEESARPSSSIAIA